MDSIHPVRRHFLSGCIGALSLILLCMGAYVAHALPIIDTNVSGEYGRLTFNWDSRKPIRASSNGNRITIAFQEAETIDIGQITKGLSPYVQNAQMSGDNKTLTLTTNRSYEIRSFMTMKGAGIDILKLNRQSPKKADESVAKTAGEITDTAPSNASQPQTPPAPVTKPDTRAKKKEKTVQPFKTPPVPASRPDRSTIANEKAQTQEATQLPPAPVKKPVRDKEKQIAASTTPQEKPTLKAPAAQATEKQPAEKKKDATKAVKAQPKPQIKAAQKPKEKTTPTPASTPARSKASVTATSKPQTTTAPIAAAKPTPATKKEAKPAAPSQSDPFVIRVQPDKVNTRIYFPWPKRTAATVFTRDDILWLIFNDKADIKLDLFESILPASILRAEEMAHPTHTILRLHTDGTVHASVSRPKRSNKWIVSLSPYRQIPAEPVKLEFQPNARTPNVFIPVLEHADSIRINDPEIGDDLLITTFYNPGVGVFPERNLNELSILQTAQGLAVARKADKVVIKELRNGLRITAKGGLALSQDLPELTMEELEVAEAAQRIFFPYDKWKVEPGKFHEAKQALEQQIWSATDVRASSLRLKLAQLYLGQGLAQEALGILDIIKQDDPNFYSSFKLSALHGGANFLMFRMQDALQDFNAKELRDEKEAQMWRDAITLYLNRDRSRFAFIDNDKAYISKYPPLMRQRLALLAAENYLDRRDHRRAYKTFDSLSEDNLLNDIEEEVDYLLARIAAEKDQIEAATAIWKKLMQSDDRFLRARAELAYVSTLYEKGELPRSKAIEHLDRLRIVWRGDALELQVLNLIGQLFVDEGRYLEGMRAMRELVNQFPTSEAAIENAQYMSELFQFLYLDNGADKMPPVKALALFYEFRELTPIGKTGDRMIQGLADRLAAVDLFGRAAELLEHQIKFRLEREERSRVGARLALIYLLNKQPKEALDTLKLTGFGKNPDKLQLQRNHLTAKSLSEINQLNKALRILADDDTAEGKQLKLSIHWENQDWPSVITAAEEVLAGRSNLTAPLSPLESNALLQLAIANVFERNEQQIAYLKEYFTPLLTDNAARNAFNFITDDSGPVDPDNFQKVAKDINNIEGFLANYRKQVAQGGLSSAIN